MERARRCFVEVNECWKWLHEHVGDEELHTQLAQDFSQCYQQALTDMSCWVDDLQLRLAISQFELDAGKALQDVQVQILPLFKAVQEKFQLSDVCMTPWLLSKSIWPRLALRCRVHCFKRNSLFGFPYHTNHIHDDDDNDDDGGGEGSVEERWIVKNWQ